MIAGNLSSPELAGIAASTVAVIPFGASEQHGPHLPLLTDTYIAESIASMVDGMISESVALFPALWFGDSIEHRGFPGTLSVGAIDLMRVLQELFSWLEAGGFRRAILYNAHGGNVNLAATICEEFSRGSSLKVLSMFAYTPAVRKLSKELFGVSETHGGSSETSLLYALRPELRKTDAASLPNPHPYAGGGLLGLYETRELPESGVLENSHAIAVDPVKGMKLAERMAGELRAKIESFPSLTAAAQ